MPEPKWRNTAGSPKNAGIGHGSARLAQLLSLGHCGRNVYTTNPNGVRFREARERVGLSPDEAALRMGISSASLWDIECCDDELTIYSPTEIRRFCQILSLSPRELFGIELQAPPLTATDLATLIREHCLSRGVTIEQFEDASGWHLVKSLAEPERFLHDDYSLDGIQDICRELGVDWQRFVLSL